MFKLAFAPEDFLVLVRNNRKAEIKYLCLEIGICTVWYVVYKNLFVPYLYCKSLEKCQNFICLLFPDLQLPKYFLLNESILLVHLNQFKNYVLQMNLLSWFKKKKDLANKGDVVYTEMFVS